MKRTEEIYRHGEHRWTLVARDPDIASYIIDTNEFLITYRDQSLLTDPGGMEIFPAVFTALSQEMDLSKLRWIFASHQDPDIISSLALWLQVNPGLRCYLSRLWTTFVPHFGGNDTTFVHIPDEGMEFYLGGLALQALPAHYLHSSGNFHLYDPAAKILFSGDVGAALMPPGDDAFFVKEFDSHIRHAEGFHRRWMGSPQAKRSWCERVAKMDIDMLCPQHGAIYSGEDVMRFINWLDELEVGHVIAA